MIPMYYIYDTAHAPEELTAKHPNAAVYSTITLFVTGAAEPSAIVDIANMELTNAELDAVVDGLLAPEPPPTDAEVQISKAQANYLYETRFKPEEVPE